MLSARRLTRFLIVTGALVAAGLGTASSAWAESCSYNPVTKSITAVITSGGQATLAVQGGALAFGEATPPPVAVARRRRTRLDRHRRQRRHPERLVVDERGGNFEPGSATEFSTPEIEFETLGDATTR